MTPLEREAVFRDARASRSLVGNPARAEQFFALLADMDARSPRRRAFLGLTPLTRGLVALGAGAVAVAASIFLSLPPWAFIGVGLIAAAGIQLKMLPDKEAIAVPPANEFVRDGVSRDTLWLFEIDEAIVDAADAQTVWDAAELAESLVSDQAWVATVSPDMDAPDFEQKVEAGVRARLREFYTSRAAS